MPNPPRPPEILLPDTFALVAGARAAYVLESDGEIGTLDAAAVAKRLRAGERPVVCHARHTAQRLGLERIDGFDVLELFAFVEPARFCLPTPGGV
ncbi:MAG: hypothetical protein HQL35_12895, partial [Alphaproteobacteria bacterium]|nr:hypothetical protein [Alphaproteobacteria bacterium]